LSYGKGAVGGHDGAPERQRRAAMLLTVICQKASGSGREVRIRVRNLSATGLGGLCTGHASFEQGEAVSIAFRNMSPLAARVVWFAGADIGIAFDRPADLERIAAARGWTGPAFSPDPFHRAADRCWRPKVRTIQPERAD
jgi:hypothetical protein